MVDEATRRRIEEWIRTSGRNEYGDAPGTQYMGGTPLFNELTGRRIDRFDYILSRHPELGKPQKD